MTDQRTVKKSLIGQEDILYGEGSATQSRAGNNYTINKVRNIQPINSIAERDALDTEKFTKVRLYENNSVTDYQYKNNSWVALVTYATPNFKSIADLLTGTMTNGVVIDMTFMVGAKVFWQGYYAQSDGGSNWGIVKSGAHTEDGGSIFTINASLYIEANLKGNKVSVKKFGAKGDANFKNGSGDWFVDAGFTTPATNNTSIFQTVCDFTWNVYVPHVPGGGYVISDLHIPINRNFYGDSNRSSKIVYSDTSTTCITLDSSSTLHHLYFLGDDSTTGIAIGFEDDTNSTDISNVQIRNIGVGISGVTPTGRPAWMLDMSKVRVDNCTRGFDFSNSDFGLMEGHTTITFYKCFVVLCTNGFRVSASSSVSLRSCAIDSASSDSVYMFACSGATIDDIRIELSSGKHGINLVRCSGVTIDGVELDANQNSDLVTSWIAVHIETFGLNISINNIYARRHFVTSGIQNSLWGCSADCTLSNSFMHVGSSEDIIDVLKTVPGNVTTIHANKGGLAVGKMIANYPLLSNGEGVGIDHNLVVEESIYGPGTYNDTTATAANVVILSDGKLQRSTSSRRWKKNERVSTFKTSSVLNLTPVLFDYKDRKNKSGGIEKGSKNCTSYIAEDSGLFTSLDLKGKPDGIDWNLISISILEELKKLKQEFEDYKNSNL